MYGDFQQGGVGLGEDGNCGIFGPQKSQKVTNLSHRDRQENVSPKKINNVLAQSEMTESRIHTHAGRHMHCNA